jgi:hypothetical protein
LRRAAHFTWERCANGLLELYATAAGKVAVA